MKNKKKNQFTPRKAKTILNKAKMKSCKCSTYSDKRLGDFVSSFPTYHPLCLPLYMII